MKTTLLLACTYALLFSKNVLGAAVKAPLDVISLDDLTEEDRATLEYLNAQRPKRSGSSDLLASIKHSIGQGIKKKIGQIAKSSASASAHFSHSSSAGGDSYHHHPPPPTVHDYDHKSFDFWTLKKSILNTLLQAVKAIKGGVIAIKGQLIKGGGKLISAKGRLISSKGEAITSLGKHIASTALLSPHPGHTGPSGHEEHHDYGPPPSHYGPPSGPSDVYGAPSAPSEDFGHHVPESHAHLHASQAQAHLHPFEDQLPNGAQAGILILKKIPKKGRDLSHVAQESKIEPFKPIKPDAHAKLLGFTDIVGKFMSASSSLNPEQPELLGTHNEPPHHYEHTASSEQQTRELDDSSSVPEEHKSEEKPKPPGTSYGVPFEEPPTGYLDFYKDPNVASASNHDPKSITGPTKPPIAEQYSGEGLQSYKNVKEETETAPLSYSENLPAGFSDISFYTNGAKYPTSPDNLPNIENFPPFPGQLPADFVAKYNLHNINQFFAGPPASQHFQDQNKSPSSKFPQSSGAINPHHMPIRVFSNEHRAKIPSSSLTAPNAKRQVKYPNKDVTRLKSQPPFDVLRSVTYKLGPHGPVKL